jgi:hypothetical protein
MRILIVEDEIKSMVQTAKDALSRIDREPFALFLLGKGPEGEQATG